MPSLPLHTRRTRWAVIPLLVVLGAVVATAAPRTAHAGQIAEKKAEARQVQAHIDELNGEVDAAVQAFNHASDQLTAVNKRVAANKRALRIAQANLKSAKEQLSTILIDGYKGQAPNVEVYVLGASSISNLMDRLDFVARANNSQQDILNQIKTSEAQIRRHRAQLLKDQARAQHLVSTRAAQKQHVEDLLNEQRNYLASVNQDIKDLIAQAAARAAAQARARAAAAAAAQAAAAKAAQQPTPTTTTSTGGGSTSTPTGGSGGGGGGGGGVSIPPAGSLGEKAVQIAMSQLGVNYVWGGASPAGFDCSGLTMWVYAQLGIHLDHYTGSQWNEGVHVSLSQLAPGDLVFFEPTLGHVGMYIGNGQFIHAPHTGTVVQIASLSGYYMSEYQGAVRVTG